MALTYKGNTYKVSSHNREKSKASKLELLHKDYNSKAYNYHDLHQQLTQRPDISYHDSYMSKETDEMMVRLIGLEVELYNLNIQIEEFS